jgi:hypothetical protein
MEEAALSVPPFAKGGQGGFALGAVEQLNGCKVDVPFPSPGGGGPGRGSTAGSSDTSASQRPPTSDQQGDCGIYINSVTKSMPADDCYLQRMLFFSKPLAWLSDPTTGVELSGSRKTFRDNSDLCGRIGTFRKQDRDLHSGYFLPNQSTYLSAAVGFWGSLSACFAL